MTNPHQPLKFEIIRYREFDIENPSHEGECAHKISLLLALNSFILIAKISRQNSEIRENYAWVALNFFLSFLDALKLFFLLGLKSNLQP